MKTIYAAQFDVASEGRASAQVFDDVVALTLEWCHGHYERSGLDVAAFAPSCRATPSDRHTLLAEDHDCSDGGRLWQLVWRYPSDDDPTALWRSEVTAAESDGRVQVSIVVRIESSRHVVAPFRYKLGRPRLVRQLVDEYACTLKGRPIVGTATELSRGQVMGFAQSVLESGDRLLPVVLVTSSRGAYPSPGALACSPDDLADSLVGLAEVYYAGDAAVTFELTEAVGKERSCFGGAIRTYWPGFDRTCDPYSHPLLLPSRISQIDDVAQWLLWTLASVSALRFVEGDVTKRARTCLRSDLKAKADQLRVMAEKGEANAEELSQLFEIADEENQSLRSQVEKLTDENEELASDLEHLQETHRANAAAMAQVRPSVDDLEQETQPTGPPGSVGEALQRAKEDFHDVLIVHPSADRSAEDSDYRDPERAYETLKSIALVYRKKFDGLGHSLIDEFNTHSLNYNSRIGGVTKGRFQHQYEREHKGDKYCIRQHVTLRGTTNVGTFCVHWAELPDKKKVLIGHVGKHLDYHKGS